MEVIQACIQLNIPAPCVTSQRMATIIDDRGEDCYAWPVQDAIRDGDWEPFENVKVTHDYEY